MQRKTGTLRHYQAFLYQLNLFAELFKMRQVQKWPHFDNRKEWESIEMYENAGFHAARCPQLEKCSHCRIQAQLMSRAAYTKTDASFYT
jgi:hypothetical protein